MRKLIIFSFLMPLLLSSCEELIDIDLNTADPRYVIEAELLSNTETQLIRVTQTVSFDEDGPHRPMEDAEVVVTASDGRVHRFYSAGEGNYRNDHFTPRSAVDYTLHVHVDGEEFRATDRLPSFVTVDSVGIVEETVFNETNYSVLFKFHDPADTDNYYKYSVSVNERPFRFLQVQSDKFNDGLYVTHQLMDFLNPFELGDTLVVRRQSVSADVYKYWNEIQLMNPGSAAPANPTSNISNGAMGYFSIANAKDYGLRIQNMNQESSENE